MSYNGWTNYETWNVALWIDNEPSTYHEARQMARDAWDESDHEKDDAERELADKLKEWVPEAFEIPTSGLAGDLIGAALSEVDWGEIAEHFLSDEIEDDEDEEDEDGDDEETEEANRE